MDNVLEDLSISHLAKKLPLLMRTQLLMEVIGSMRKMLFLGLLFTLCSILVSSNLMSVTAESGMVFVGSVGGAPVIEHPGMTVEFLDFRSSPCGRADAIMVSMLIDSMEVPILAVTDNAEFGALLGQLFGGQVPVETVEEEELEVWRHGRTLFAELTVKVGDLHPVYAEFKGSSGAPIFGEESVALPGYELTMKYIAFYAIATFKSGGSQCQQTIGIMGPQFLMKVIPT